MNRGNGGQHSLHGGVFFSWRLTRFKCVVARNQREAAAVVLRNAFKTKIGFSMLNASKS